MGPKALDSRKLKEVATWLEGMVCYQQWIIEFRN